MGKNAKVLCLIISITIIVSLFPLSACDKTTNETENYHSKETFVSAIEPEESDVTETSVTEEEEEQPTTKEMAVLIAQRVGIKEEDLKGKYELFLEYAKIVADNPELNDYRGHVYKIFPVVAEQINDENKDYFFDGVRSLVIKEYPSDSSSAYYDQGINTIIVGADIKYTLSDDEKDTYVYHELLHFVDDYIDGEAATISVDNDGVFSEITVHDVYFDPDMDLNLLAYKMNEGSTEYLACKYFGFYQRINIYFASTEFFTGLEYILGYDETEKLIFDHNSELRFLGLLQKNGFSDDEIIAFFNGVTYTTLWRTSSESLKAPMDILIRLYENNIGPDYAEDPEFCRILLAVNKFPLMESEYDDFIRSIDYDLESEQTQAAEIIEGEYGAVLVDDSIGDVSPIMIDGTLKLSTEFRISGDEGESRKIFIMDYDFDTCKMTDHEFRDVNSPIDPFDKLDPDSDDFLKLMDELKPDVSDAHNQKVQGNDDDLQACYRRAKDIGNKYGIQFWFADLTPDGVIFNPSTVITDPAVIGNTLDRIESVLSLYPEDYFDQLQFEYYDGFAICLYSGWFDYAYKDFVYVDGKYYMTIFVDAIISETQGYFGADDLRTRYFGSEWALEAELICDIWDITEKYISNRNDHMSITSVNEDTWQALNPESFEYSYSELEENLVSFDETGYSQFFLNKECVSFSKTDRILTYEYLMLLTLSGKSDTEIDQHCKDKIEELKRAIRCSFDSSEWPDECSWERIDF